MTTEAKILQAWDFVFERLMHPATNQIYDYRTSEEPDGAWRHLATPAEIAASIPNPCGWFSGMENTDINGGIMLDGALDRYEQTKDAAVLPYIERLYDGLMRNTRVSTQEGFLARGVLPTDGKTHYINSSRDQYTHWICAMYHYYRSPLCTDVQKKEITDALCAFARKAERDVTAENKWLLLREDGRPALVCDMLGEHVMWHEIHRLPMFYMAAYATSGDTHWKELYLSLREQALSFAEQIVFDRNIFKNVLAFLQMQESLRLLHDCEEDEDYRARYLHLMQRVAKATEAYLPDALAFLQSSEIPRTILSWRDCPAEFVKDKGLSQGLAVIKPDVLSAAGERMWFIIHNAAECILVQALCPGYKIAEGQVQMFEKAVQIIDFANAFSDYPVTFCAAYYALMGSADLPK